MPNNRPGREPHAVQPPDEPPPFLGAWSRLYVAVALYLCGFIAMLAFFTWSYQK